MDSYNMNQQNYNGQINNTYPNSKFTFYLILGIIQLVCCNQISGIITTIYASIANTDYNKGDFIGYEKDIKVCKWATIIGVGFSFILIVIYLFLVLIPLMIAIVNEM